MKIIKRFQEDCECQAKNCKERASARIYGLKLCRRHYIYKKLEMRMREKKEENDL